MIRNGLGVALVAALVVFAGCMGGPAGSPTGDAPTDGGDAGTIDFYVSDEPNAIGDFQHLNVTITKVGLHRTGDAGTATETPNETATATANATVTTTPANETDAETGDGERERETERDGDGEWIEHEVNATVDLTRLVGDNATKLDALEAPVGSYDKVFVYVSEINATLENGESVNVKLPSERLHINEQFDVSAGSNVSFVFDIAVHEAGNSGKYILKPVVSQSGTDVPVEEVGDSDERDDDADERDDERSDDDNETAEREDDESADADRPDVEGLDATFVGSVAAGENATVKVTGDGGPVANATVTANGEVVGRTAADGTISFQVPTDAEEIEVTVEYGDGEVELERELGRDGGGQALVAPSG